MNGREPEARRSILDLADCSPQEERRHKVERVRNALQAQDLPDTVHAWHPSPRRRGARARISLRYSRTGEPGMFAPGSHRPVPAPLEPMARPELVRAAQGLQQHLAGGGGWPAGRAASLRVELRSDGERVVAVADPRGGRRRLDRDRLRSWAEALGPAGAVAVGTRGVTGDPRIRIRSGSVWLSLGPTTFYQVNLEVNELLVRRVRERVLEAGPVAVADFFGGAGNLSVEIAAQGIPVTLYEGHRAAAADARRNARSHDLPLEVREGDVGRFRAGESFFDCAILDPPRRGAGDVLQRIALTRPAVILLVSCAPPALARDVALAREAGYRLERLELFDLFPLTSHVESMAVLRA